MVKLFMFYWFLFFKCFINCLEYLCKGFIFLGGFLINKENYYRMYVDWVIVL